MSNIKGKYVQILEDLENNIKNPEDLDYAKEKMMELSMAFMDVIDRLTALTDAKIKEIEARQEEINNKVSNVQSLVNEIESDIYEEDEGYEFEIVCPYCNHASAAFDSHKKRFGGPCVHCEQCKRIVIDPTIIEWSIYPFWKKVQAILVRPAMLGAIILPIVLYLIRPSLFEVLFYFVCFVAIVIGAGLADALHSKNDSLWRTSNLAYVKALIAEGYPVSQKVANRIFALGDQVPCEDWGKMMEIRKS